jgi:hypothetical protein
MTIVPMEKLIVGVITFVNSNVTMRIIHEIAMMMNVVNRAL